MQLVQKVRLAIHKGRERAPRKAAGRYGLDRVRREGGLVGQGKAHEVAGQPKTNDLATPIGQELVKANYPLRDVVDRVCRGALQNDRLFLTVVHVLRYGLKQS